MAYLYEAWVKDGKNGEARYDWIRNDMPGFNQLILRSQLAHWQSMPTVVRITKTRTEKQEVFENLWLRTGYEDPFLLPEER